MFYSSFIGQQMLVDKASKPSSFYHLSIIFRRLFAETRRLSQAENNPSLCTVPLMDALQRQFRLYIPFLKI
jgi:hypothetical protein